MECAGKCLSDENCTAFFWVAGLCQIADAHYYAEDLDPSVSTTVYLELGLVPGSMQFDFFASSIFM